MKAGGMETVKKEREKEEEGEIVGREKSMGGRKGGRERDSREGERGRRGREGERKGGTEVEGGKS